MKTKQKFRFLLFSALLVFICLGVIIALADQENEIIIPHEHEYQIVSFDKGIITFECEICDDTYTDDFTDHINEIGYASLDLNNDNIVNAKDYAYLMKNY